MIETRSIVGGVGTLLLLTVGIDGASDVRVVQAVRGGDSAAVRALLERKADVNAPEVDGTTALHWAVRADDAETVARLIRAGAKANATNRYGVTPLSIAVSIGNPVIVEALVKAGADARFTGPEGETALMIASRTGRVEVVRVLLARGADVNAKERWYGQTALMWAAAENHPAVVRALIDAGATIDARADLLGPPKRDIADFRTDKNGLALQTLLTTFPKQGLTPLLFAARQGAVDAVRGLADAGPDLNLGDPDGITPMILAIRTGTTTRCGAVEKGAISTPPIPRWQKSRACRSTCLLTGFRIGRPPSHQASSTASTRTLLEKGASANVRSGVAARRCGDAVGAQNAFYGVLSAGSMRCSSAPPRTPTGRDAPAARAGADPERRDPRPCYAP